MTTHRHDIDTALELLADAAWASGLSREVEAGIRALVGKDRQDLYTDLRILEESKPPHDFWVAVVFVKELLKEESKKTLQDVTNQCQKCHGL